jgi:hypothetical protein
LCLNKPPLGNRRGTPSHPFIDGVSLTTNQLLGVPSMGETPASSFWHKPFTKWEYPPFCETSIWEKNT